MIRRLAANGISSSSSLSHRLASSCATSSSTSTLASSQCRPSMSSGGKGRLRMRGGSISARIVANRQARQQQSERATLQPISVPRLGRGRSSRRLSTRPASTPFVHTDKASASDALHLGLTPAHMPLPIPLGTEQYFSQRGERYNPVPTPGQWSNAELGPFDTSIADQTILHGDLDAMVKANGSSFDSFHTTLSDHLHVMFTLARPARTQYLGTQVSPEFFDANSPTLASRLNSAVNEAGTKNALAAEKEWEAVLAKLGQAGRAQEGKAAAAQVSQAERGAVDAAVSDLNDLLGEMALDESRAMAGGRKKAGSARMMCVVDGEDGEEQWIRMDSTRRKRKKKINKHKFKKRRKVSRVDSASSWR